MDFVFLGIQGSGKGTQARKIAQKYGYGIFEMGRVLREFIKTETPLAKEVKEIINKGNLLDNERLVRVFRDVVNKMKKDGELKDKMIFDGIPRRFGQDEQFDEWMKSEGREFRIVNIVISEEEALNRLVRRRVCEDCGAPFTFDYKSDVCDKCGGNVVVREDENAGAIRQRIEDFKTFTLPMLEAYRERGVVVDINGEQSIEDVAIEIETKLKEYLEV